MPLELGSASQAVRSRGHAPPPLSAGEPRTPADAGAAAATHTAANARGSSHGDDATVIDAGIPTPPADDGDKEFLYPPPSHHSSTGAPGLARAYPAPSWAASLGAALAPVEWRIVGAVALAAAFFRFWNLERPSSVVFDEVHFGNFAGKYIRRHFFMDVHPPLAKLLITLAAWMGGYDGNFDFSGIGNEYLAGGLPGQPVPYVAMRRVSALCGWALIPVAYITLRAAGVRTGSALVGAGFVLLDNALATQSRYILLDAPLVLFTATSVLCWVCFGREDARMPFSRPWWIWLLATGASLGLVISVKWVGLATVALIGAATALQLWFRLADRHTTLWGLVRHVWARVVGLIVLPLVVYASIFWIHFTVLNESGDGDAFMSPQFAHSLQGGEMPDTYLNVALGSAVTIRHLNTKGGYLHSHAFNYETGSKQQQITLYPHADENNVWEIVAAPGPDAPAQVDANGVPLTLPPGSPRDVEKHWTQLEWLKDGTEVRLTHRATDKRMHSHNHRPPITENDNKMEVSGYGSPGFTGDGNDNWVVEIDKIDTPNTGTAREQVQALRTVFRLRHYNSGCYLFSHNVHLPDWGFGQQEVMCVQWPTRPNSLFYIETNTHPLLVRDDAHAQKVNYPRPSFWAKLVELQKVMWTTNKGLTSRHAYDSRPHQWPFLRRGVNYWSREHRQVYFIGNPLIWVLGVVAVGAYLVARVLIILRVKRGKGDLHNSSVTFYDGLLAFLVAGYAVHYLPFFVLGRQLFLHHYLPALYFAILVFSTVWDAATAHLAPRTRVHSSVVLLLVALFVFCRLAPLMNAGKWTQHQCENARLRPTWDFDCHHFPTDIKAYDSWPGPVHSSLPSLPSNFPPLPTLPPQATQQPSMHTSPLSSSAAPSFGAAAPADNAFQPKVHASVGAGAGAGSGQSAQQPALQPAQQPAEGNAPPAENAGAGSGASVPAVAAAPSSSSSPSTWQSLPAPQSSVAAGDALHPHGLDVKQIQNMVLGGTTVAGLKATDTTAAQGTTAAR